LRKVHAHISGGKYTETDRDRERAVIHVGTLVVSRISAHESPIRVL
jgi:hypothetical protein